MRIKLQIFLIWLAVIMSSFESFGVPAAPGNFEFSQPDGSKFKASLHGDEFYHRMETTDGYSVSFNKGSECYEYLNLDASGRFIGTGLKAGIDDPAKHGIPRNLKEKASVIKEKLSARKALRAKTPFRFPQSSQAVQSSQSAPADQTQKSISGAVTPLVILANFSDTSTTFTSAVINSLFNTPGYNLNGADGSVKDYYNETSYNQLNVTATVSAWVTLPHTKAYYGANDAWGEDLRPQEMVLDAIKELEKTGFNFTPFDADHNGNLDFPLDVIHQGGGEEAGAGANTIWSHAWSLASPYTTADGVTIYDYHTEPEKNGSDLTTIGVICHEMGHAVCNLPDLYDTDDSSEGIGSWCLMAAGSWNGIDGNRPAHMSAWAKLQCGWVTPQTLAANQSGVSVLKGNSNQSIFKITNGMLLPNEYLLIENRQKNGFDDGLPAAGLLVWHVDDSIATNRNETHYKVALLQADGNKNLENADNRGDGGDPYPGTSNKRTISSATNPNTNSYTNGATSTVISSISDSASTMTFNLELTPGGDSSQIATDVTSVSVSEGSTATFRVKLTSLPSTSKTVSVARFSGDSNITVTSGSSLTFTTLNWATYQTVTLAAAEDLDLTNGSAVIRCSSAGMTDKDVTATEADNDTNGFTLSKATMTVSENGGTDTFTVVLTAQPASNVVFSVTSSATGEATVSPATLTFTTANWNSPQTVTVTGVNDNTVANHGATITVSVVDASSDNNWDPLADKTVIVNCTDNDIAGFTIGLISGNTSEAGGTATFTVKLKTQPSADVSIGLSSSDTTEGTVNPASLTFTSGNWDTNQTVTVTGVYDALLDGNITYSIVIAAATSADPNYNGLNPSDVAVINNDDGYTLTVSNDGNGTTVPSGASVQTKGVAATVSATPNAGYHFLNWTLTSGSATIANANSASTTATASADASIRANFALNNVQIMTDLTSIAINEGVTNSFQVKLTLQPTESKTVSVSRISGDGDITVSSGSILTFTTSNWNTYQTVTLAAAQDSDLANGSAVIRCSSSGMADKDITATEADNDYNLTVNNNGNGIVVPSGTSLQEKGAALQLSATANTGYHFVNWTVTSGSAAFGDTNSGSTTVTASADTTILANFALNNVQITTDVASLYVNEGSSASFRVKLSAQPILDKTVTVSKTSGDADISITGGASLTFTSANWNTYRTVTLADAEDPDIANGVAFITCASAGCNNATVIATEIDNDIPGFTVGTISGNTTEAGVTATFTLKLKTLPSADVIIGLSSSDTTEGTVNPASLTFTPGNWDTNQTVTVTGVDDSLLDGNITYSIVTAAAASADPNYNGLNPSDVTVINNDNDYTLTVGNNGNGITVPAGASVQTKGVAATVTATPSAGYHFVNWTLTSGSATFANANSASTTATASADATIRANFALNNVQITTDLTSLDINEGSTNTFQVKLTMQPAVSKTVSVSRVLGDGDITVSSGSSLTFTTSNWDTYQTVILAAAQDSDTANGSATIKCSSSGMTDKDITANESDNDYTLTVNNDGNGTTAPSGASVQTKGASVSISATANTGYHFANWTVAVGSATFADANSASTSVNASAEATLRANFVLNNVQITTNSTSVDINEGSTNTFQVKLTMQPAVSKTVSVSKISGDSDITVSSGSSLNFTTSNWGTYQTVTLAAGQDADAVNSSATIRCSSTDMDDKDITASEVDNDTTLTVNNNGFGTTTPSGAATVTMGSVTGVSATAGTGYHFANWTVTGGSATFTDANTASTNVTISTPAEICANFTINAYTLTYTAGANGTINGTTVQSVNHGADGAAVTAVPDTGYHFTGWSDGILTATRTDTNITGAKSITASFAIDTHTLTYRATNGTISGHAVQTINYGSDGLSVTAVANADCYFLSWSDGLKSLTRHETNVIADATFTANFRTNVFMAPSSYSLEDIAGGQKIFIINGLAGQKYLTVELKDVSGDCDLYLKHASQPTLQLYNFKSTKGPDMNEIITVPNPADGNWYIMVYAYDRYSGATLSVDFGTDVLGTPTNLVASAGNPPDKQITLTWDAANGAASYEIYRCDVNIPELATKINTAEEVTGTAYNDEFSGAGYYRYYYWVRSVDGSGLKSDFSDSTEGATTEGDAVPLKNGTTLKGRAGAAGAINAYSINIPDNLQTLLEIRVSGGTGNCDFDVVSPDGTIVKPRTGVNGNELLQTASPANGDWIIHIYGRTAYSGLSLTAKYIKQTAAPAAPAGVNASDGVFDNRIVVTWTAVSGASSYLVGRKKSLSDVGFEQEFETADPILEDNSQAVLDARPGTLFYYFVAAENSFGPGNYSMGNSGYLSKSPSASGTVTASDGTYFDKIRVSWTKVNGATSYLVFRTESVAITPNPKTGTYLIGETTALFLDDFGDGLDITKKYYYWFAAKNANDITAISKPNDGYLSNKGPSTVTASNGTYSERIVVTWTAVPGATAYDVYRYTDAKFTDNEIKVGAKVTALEYEDTQVVAGTTYYYKVNAKYEPGNYDSALSLKGAAGKATDALNPSATPLLNGVESNNIANMAIGSSLYFSIDVPMGTTRMVATLAGNEPPFGKSNDCDLFARFANFPTTALYNAKGVENKFNEILTVSNPAPGAWYFMLYGTTHSTNVALTVSYYTVADIVLTQVPANNLPFPLTAKFKGKVVDGADTGIPGIVIQVRNPITGHTSSLTKTDANGVFSYSAPINFEGEHTFDFFFTEIPDNAKGTASHTVATRKSCLETNNFFDSAVYLPATPVPLPVQADISGLQTFLNIRNGWDDSGIVNPDDPYETIWLNSTLFKSEHDAQLLGKLDEGLYMFFYGVEGAGVGNDTTTAPALSAVPLVVHVAPWATRATVLDKLMELGIIDQTQKDAILSGSKIGVVTVAALRNPVEGQNEGDKNISLLAREQLEVLADIAGNTANIAFVDGRKDSSTVSKLITLTLASGRDINVIAYSFLK